MKAYVVKHKLDGIHDAHSKLVYANTDGQARSFALKSGYFDDCDFIDLIAHRCKIADKYHIHDKGNYIETDTNVWRESLLRSYDGQLCLCCDRDDFCQDKWRVCPMCGHCPECGHDIDCPSALCPEKS